jgi:Fe-Mn family superoxide dismutase
MDYGAKAASYVDAYMEVISWDNAVKLYERYRKFGSSQRRPR